MYKLHVDHNTMVKEQPQTNVQKTLLFMTEYQWPVDAATTSEQEEVKAWRAHMAICNSTLHNIQTLHSTTSGDAVLTFFFFFFFKSMFNAC